MHAACRSSVRRCAMLRPRHACSWSSSNANSNCAANDQCTDACIAMLPAFALWQCFWHKWHLRVALRDGIMEGHASLPESWHGQARIATNTSRPRSGKTVSLRSQPTRLLSVSNGPWGLGMWLPCSLAWAGLKQATDVCNTKGGITYDRKNLRSALQP